MVAVSSYIYVGNKRSYYCNWHIYVPQHHPTNLQAILQGMYKQEIELVVYPKLGMQG